MNAETPPRDFPRGELGAVRSPFVSIPQELLDELGRVEPTTVETPRGWDAPVAWWEADGERLRAPAGWSPTLERWVWTIDEWSQRSLWGANAWGGYLGSCMSAAKVEATVRKVVRAWTEAQQTTLF